MFYAPDGVTSKRPNPARHRGSAGQSTKHTVLPLARTHLWRSTLIALLLHHDLTRLDLHADEQREVQFPGRRIRRISGESRDLIASALYLDLRPDVNGHVWSLSPGAANALPFASTVQHPALKCPRRTSGQATRRPRGRSFHEATLRT